MAEYWKSTPKYWCKHCSTFVKDTKFERTQHEATGKHQGNLKRFLRGIQNDHEKSEREKQRAKSEVERLNRAVAGGPNASISNPTQNFARRAPSVPAPGLAADQKRQMAQLAEMGVALPDDHRGRMALAGEWQVVSQTLLHQDGGTDKGPSLNLGVRKRKINDHEEEEEEREEEACRRGNKKGWGSTIKDYPSDSKAGVDALLASSIHLKRGELVIPKEQSHSLDLTAGQECCDAIGAEEDQVKTEDSPERSVGSEPPRPNPEKFADITPVPSDVTFKKRKGKAKANRYK